MLSLKFLLGFAFQFHTLPLPARAPEHPAEALENVEFLSTHLCRDVGLVEGKIRRGDPPHWPPLGHYR